MNKQPVSITIKGRTWSIGAGNRNSAALTAHLQSRGWDGLTYNGTSHPVGRQVGTLVGMFYRSTTTGEFEVVSSYHEQAAA